jgi:hypothetical protein
MAAAVPNTFAVEAAAATEKFKAAYEAKSAAILAMPPAAHPPISAKLDEWVAAQASERRRKAAAALRDNLQYIPHREVIEYSSRITDSLYEKPIPAEKKLVWYAGAPSKSAYFISILCYHFARVKGYRLPDEIVEAIRYTGENNFVLFIFDDMAYSGSQMNGMLKAFWSATVRTKFPEESIINLKKIDVAGVEHLDIRVGLCCAAESALGTLQTFKFSLFGMFDSTKIINGEVRSPYMLHVAKIVPSLKDVLDPKVYTDCIMYFNPYAGPTTQCICYFDHKVADPVSTFTNVLLFGVVPPSKLNYDKLYSYENVKGYRSGPLYNQHEEVIDRDIPETQFIPFIKDCPPYDFAALAKLPYHHLMIYQDSDGHETDPEGDWKAAYNFFLIDSATIPPEKNSVKRRCPTSWYKTFFKGGSRKDRKTKKRSVRNHKRSTNRNGRL